MDTRLTTGLWNQFGAALDTLEDAMNLCPDHLWAAALWQDTDDAKYGQFWFICYHTLSWTDLFLLGDYKSFAPPPPFTRGVLPEQPYTKEQIYTYLDVCRQKCQSTFENLTDEQAYKICIFDWIEAPYIEMMFYSMRHVQEHAAQLNLFLGEQGITGQDWVARVRSKTT